MLFRSSRPSALLGITEPLVALALDEALALRLRVERQQSRGVRDGLPYATEADFEDDDWRGPVEVAYPVH